MTVLETLQAIPCVQVIYSDAEKVFCSVRMTIKRDEQINSGSMQFTHPRYYTFGQLVVFTDQEINQDQAGALFFKAETGEEAAEIIGRITNYIMPEKAVPDDSVPIGE